MEVNVNITAILLAAIANIIIAAVWYAVIFGRVWHKLTGIKEIKISGTNIAMVLTGSLIMSFVLYHSIAFGNAYVNMQGIEGGLMGGLFGWLGYIAPVTLIAKIYERRSWTLWLLDTGFWLVSLLVMGMILSFWV
jgi:hypothetical protein